MSGMSGKNGKNGSGKRKWIGRAMALLVLAGVVAAVVAGVTKGGGDDKLDDALIAKVMKKDLAVEVIDTGKIEPREKVDIKSKVAGQVLDVLVDEGQVVTKGQLLLRLDPVDYAREVARADAEQAQAQQALAFAEQAHGRKKAGLAERAVSQADVELAHNEVDMRRASVRIADVAVNAARDRLRSCEIRSPMDGTVIVRGIEPGEVVTPGVQATFDGKPLLTVADLSTLIARVELNQIDVARVTLGQGAKLTLDALPDHAFLAVVTKIAPAAVKAEGRDVEVFPVEATLTGPAPAPSLTEAGSPAARADAGAAGESEQHGAGADAAAIAVTDAKVPVTGAATATASAPANAGVKSGMTADVRILVETKPQVLLVPIEAVIKEDGKSFLKKVVIKDGKKTRGDKSAVKTGKSNDREIEVIEGAAEGDEVVIDPASSKENEANL